MSEETDSMVTALMLGWWIGAAYPRAGVIGIVIFAVLCAILDKRKVIDRGAAK